MPGLSEVAICTKFESESDILSKLGAQSECQRTVRCICPSIFPHPIVCMRKARRCSRPNNIGYSHSVLNQVACISGRILLNSPSLLHAAWRVVHVRVLPDPVTSCSATLQRRSVKTRERLNLPLPMVHTSGFPYGNPYFSPKFAVQDTKTVRPYIHPREILFKGKKPPYLQQAYLTKSLVPFPSST